MSSSSRKPMPKLAAAVALVALSSCASDRQDPRASMTFFVTSTSPGHGGNLGGLVGADAHCQSLAEAASRAAGRREWRAYLSVQPAAGQPGVNARDRIGTGPWQNANGVVIAASIDGLHGQNNLNSATALTETGAAVPGRGQTPNLHDVLTGSQPDGRYDPGAVDMTCRRWTQESGGAAMVGHSDRTGLDNSAPATSWNSSHLSRGCSPTELAATGGGGLLYCFAAR